jgi:integrase
MAYLLKRRGGRLYFQLRLGKSLASCLGWSHLRVALRTTDSREARRRVATMMDWSFAFRDAESVQDAGYSLAEKLRPLVTAGPPQTKRDLEDRKVLEGMAYDFITRCREKAFNVLEIPNFYTLFYMFVAQNVATENRLVLPAETTVAPAPPTEPAPPTAPGLIDLIRSIEALSAEVQSLRQTTPAPAASQMRDVAATRHVATTPDATATPDAATTLAPVARPSETVTLSQAVDRYLDAEAKRRQSRKSDALLGPILGFLVDFLADKPLADISDDELARVDLAVLDIPHFAGAGGDLRKSLYKRYLRAKETQWRGLRRTSETTIKLRYQRPLRLFFEWLIEQKLWIRPAPVFAATTDEAMAVLPRDRPTDEELLRFVSTPLFTGCVSRERVWRAGHYFYQGDLYWQFLILLFTGMRTGEPPQLKLDDLVMVEEGAADGSLRRHYFFDLRPFDPAKGRIAIKELKHLKRGDYSRVVPVHPILVELGLIERAERLRAAGETHLFPGWRAHTSAVGEVRWGKTLSRAFDYGRKLPHIELTRPNFSLYSFRHLMGDWLDSASAPERVRHRVLGHRDKSSNASGHYGGKGFLPPEQAEFVTDLKIPIVQKMRQILIEAKSAADEGRLTTLDPLIRPRGKPESEASAPSTKAPARRKPPAKASRRVTKTGAGTAF